MKTSIAAAMFMVVGAGAASVAALVSPYQGSDTLFNITTDVISVLGLFPSTAYIGGGSGNGEAAMAQTPAALQVTAPMSKMLTATTAACGFNGGGAGLNNAAGIVIGLDGVDLFSSTSSAGSVACNGTTDNAGTGLAFSGTQGVFTDGGATSNPSQNWKWILALLYGGKDLTNNKVDCAQPSRQQLVANWNLLFQAAGGAGGCNANSLCTGGTGGTIPLVCSDGTTAGNNTCKTAAAGAACGTGTGKCTAGPVLWHAFRRDDTSGTSDVFSSILGLSPSTSNSSNNGFGASPYCNALNWDTSAGNANCALGNNKQWTGPGGVLDPVANDGSHRRPPPGVWGDNPDPNAGAKGADVLPTEQQDNDPIRRPCLGNGAVGNAARTGDEVCNIDGSLGLVVPMMDADFIPKTLAGAVQYPTKGCGLFVAGKPVGVLTCAVRSQSSHSGECPNGDSLAGGDCFVPIDNSNASALNGQCFNSKTQLPTNHARATAATADGRFYNSQLRSMQVFGAAQASSNTLIQAPIPACNNPSTGTACTTPTVDFAGAFYRLHSMETVAGSTVSTACQMTDMTDQIGCLAQTDPCSIGYAGDGAKQWATSSTDHNGFTGGTVGAIDSVRVAQVYPQASSVQLLGQAGEYQVARKLYFNSLVGFASLVGGGGATTVDTNTADEFTIAKNESTGAFMNPILTQFGEFPLGAQLPGTPAGGHDPQFCEDFNEQNVCNDGGLPANVNGCTNAVAGTTNQGALGMTQNTVCGDGVRGPYEECDNGTLNGHQGSVAGACSLTCRCVNDFVAGNCN